MIGKNKYKRLTSILVLLASILRSQVTATEYLDVIGKEFNVIQKNTWEYTRSAAHGKRAKKVEKKRKEVILSNQDAIRKISRLKSFDGNNDLRDSALSFLKINYAVLNEDYAKLVNLEDIAEESYDAMEAYIMAKSKAYEKLQSAGEMIDREYRQFARKYNVEVNTGDDRLSKNMDIAGDVYTHYNEVYLLFFKSFKQEGYLIDAIRTDDVNGLEQNRIALSKSASEGLKKLQSVMPYNGDESLVKACGNLLNFYKEESEKELASVPAFFVRRDNFQKLKSTFPVRGNSRSTEETERYNKLVTEYNKELDHFNNIMNDLNKRRALLVGEWNIACDRFTDKHVPKR